MAFPQHNPLNKQKTTVPTTLCSQSRVQNASDHLETILRILLTRALVIYCACRLKGEMDKLKDEQEGTITKERVKFSKEMKVRYI